MVQKTNVTTIMSFHWLILCLVHLTFIIYINNDNTKVTFETDRITSCYGEVIPLKVSDIPSYYNSVFFSSIVIWQQTTFYQYFCGLNITTTYIGGVVTYYHSKASDFTQLFAWSHAAFSFWCLSFLRFYHLTGYCLSLLFL